MRPERERHELECEQHLGTLSARLDFP